MRCAQACSARGASATRCSGAVVRSGLSRRGRLERILGAARRAADERFCEQTVSRLEQLVGDEPPTEGQPATGGPWLLAELKADPGRVGLESLLAEIAKLERARSLGLPVDLFADVPEARVAAWRARAALEHPAWLRAHPRDVRLTLLACLCSARVGEITDALIEQPGFPAHTRCVGAATARIQLCVITYDLRCQPQPTLPRCPP